MKRIVKNLSFTRIDLFSMTLLDRYIIKKEEERKLTKYSFYDKIDTGELLNILNR